MGNCANIMWADFSWVLLDFSFSLSPPLTNTHAAHIRSHKKWLTLAHKRKPLLCWFYLIKVRALGCQLYSGTKSKICGVRSPSKLLLSWEAQREHWRSTDQLKARPFIIVDQMKEPKCLFLPPISFSLPISHFLASSLFPPSPVLLSSPLSKIQWE